MAIFVVLVSVQAAKDWPIAGLVGGDDAVSTSVGPGRPAAAVKARAAATRAARPAKAGGGSQPAGGAAGGAGVQSRRPATDRA